MNNFSLFVSIYDENIVLSAHMWQVALVSIHNSMGFLMLLHFETTVDKLIFDILSNNASNSMTFTWDCILGLQHMFE